MKRDIIKENRPVKGGKALAGDTVLKESLPYVTRYYNEHYRYYRMPEHSHPEDEIMYAENGVCRVVCADGAGVRRTVTLTDGTYIFIRGGVTHNLFIDRECACRLLNVEYRFREDRRTDGEGPREGWSVLRDDGSLLTVLKLLHDKLRDRDQDAYLTAEDAEYDIGLAVLLLDHKIRMQQAKPPAVPGNRERYAEMAKRYIGEHYTDPMTVAEIAEEVRIAPAYLQRLFKAQTGMTITAYVNALRLNRSKYILTHSDLSLTDVAVNAGIGTRQRLTQLFREKEGMSPGEYRRIHRNREFEGDQKTALPVGL